jgi:hypothetical protein
VVERVKTLLSGTIGSIPQRCDATKQAKFLFNCVLDTINRIILEEVSYIYKYYEFKRFLGDRFEMPDKMVSLLVRFLEHNRGTVAQRAKTKEFSLLNDIDVIEIENHFKEIFERQ